jgi:hypothetical protein
LPFPVPLNTHLHVEKENGFEFIQYTSLFQKSVQVIQMILLEFYRNKARAIDHGAMSSTKCPRLSRTFGAATYGVHLESLACLPFNVLARIEEWPCLKKIGIASMKAPPQTFESHIKWKYSRRLLRDRFSSMCAVCDNERGRPCVPTASSGVHHSNGDHIGEQGRCKPCRRRLHLGGLHEYMGLVA